MSRQPELTAYGLNVLDAWDDVQDAHFMLEWKDHFPNEAVAYQGSKATALQRLTRALKEMDDAAKIRGTYEDPPLPAWMFSSIHNNNNKR